MYRPVNEWPLILVGPIVRRVTDASVAVWVATARPCSVRLVLYDGTAPAAAPLGWEAEDHTRTIGARLHVAVLEAFDVGGQTASLTPGVVYGYDLELREDVDGQPPWLSLANLNLLDDDPAEGVLALGYLPNHRPGFCLPGPLPQLRMVHASCRKAHGDGVDVLPTVDSLIERSVTDPSALAERPQQLFLSGDQIYADDVATALLHTLREVGFQMLGWEETFPLVDGSTVGRTHPSVDLLHRDAFMADQLKKPETHYAVNHLLFLGEWLAMYAMCWSPALWKRATESPLRYTFELPSSLLWPPPREGMGDTTPAVLEMAELLPKTRRALANVATYMIFDDHEVTDDWNLNGLLARRFRSVPAGCRIFRNALIAYAVFQDWGNKPEDYVAGTMGGELLDRIAGEGAFANQSIQQNPDGPNAILDCGQILDPEAMLPVANPSARMRWDYDIVGPQHRVIVLDTRTWRFFPELDPNLVGAGIVEQLIWHAARQEPFTPGSLLQTAARNLIAGTQKLNAGLILETAMDFQIDDRLADPFRHREMLFVVSPAPVLTFPFVDITQRTLVRLTGTNTAKLREQGEEKWENEPWIGNYRCYRSLLSRFRTHLETGDVVFLSGDVHYGYTAEAAFEDVDTNDQTWSGRFVQLCSSASRNSSSINRLMTVIDWMMDPNASAVARGDALEAGTGYVVFPDEARLAPSGADSFREEVIAEMEAERAHLQTAIRNHDDYGEIASAILDGRRLDAGHEVIEWLQLEIQLEWQKLNRLGFDAFEFLLGDSFYAAPGHASQTAQTVALAMATHNIPSLLSWSLAHDFKYDRRPGRAVKPPWLTEAAWTADERTLYERLNYCSVGDTNVGVIRFVEQRNQTGVLLGHALLHELLWYHDQSVLAHQPDPCTTQHIVDFTAPGPVPWSQRLAE
jgi:hypothetical protein